MKNTKKKLTLSRETVQGLETAALQKVRGGIYQDQSPFLIISCFCSADC